MNTRLKRITALATMSAALFVAAPAQAGQDNGNGKQQRCEAAVNGKHNGFSCIEILDDDVVGQCPRGYTLTAIGGIALDWNTNNQICVLNRR